MGYLLGVDLGTTFTTAAIRRGVAGGWGPAEMVPLGGRSTSVGSVLYFAADSPVLVGDAAERRAATDPSGVAREFKRRIGDPAPLVVSGVPHSAHALTARLARWVVDFVTSREGRSPERIAMTHPARWGSHQTALFASALGEVGLGNVVLLSEPAAAATAYASAERGEPGATIGVYDLGGGTFDAAVLRGTRLGTFDLLGEPAGDERLGGVDFDQVIFEWLRAQFPELLSTVAEGDPVAQSAVARLRRECVEAKEALSADTEVTIPVLLPTGQAQARLVRAEFEAMIRPSLEKTVELTRNAIRSAGVSESDLSSVLLVGGSSRIPLVMELLSAGLGRPIAVDTDPKATVAVGAVLAADLDKAVRPPIRPAAGVLPSHLHGPARRRPRRFVPRPRVLVAGAGLSLLVIAGSTLVRGPGQMADLAAPVQAATPTSAAAAPALATTSQWVPWTSRHSRSTTKATISSTSQTQTAAVVTTTTTQTQRQQQQTTPTTTTQQSTPTRTTTGTPVTTTTTKHTVVPTTRTKPPTTTTKHKAVSHRGRSTR